MPLRQMNNSATGGYIQPTLVIDKNDQVLDTFLQGVVSGITGISGDLVRPRWQTEPPTIPAFGVDWAAIGEQRRTSDAFAQDFASGSAIPGVNDSKYRNEQLEILCSFYGPNARSNAVKFSIGLQVAQNREQLQLNGFALIGVEDMVSVPEQIQNKWLFRSDVMFRVRRAQEYTYSILDLLASEIEVKDDTGAVNLEVSVDSRSVQQLPLFAFDLPTSAYAGWDNGNWS